MACIVHPCVISANDDNAAWKDNDAGDRQHRQRHATRESAVSQMHSSELNASADARNAGINLESFPTNLHANRHLSACVRQSSHVMLEIADYKTIMYVRMWSGFTNVRTDIREINLGDLAIKK